MEVVIASKGGLIESEGEITLNKLESIKALRL